MTESAPTPDFDKDALLLRFHEQIPSTSEAVNEVVPRLLEIVRELECAPGEADKVELALHEALNNAVLHGSGENPEKKVEIICLCDETRGILLSVRDSGPGFDPKDIPDPREAQNIYSSHGRGIYLIRELMDDVRFEDGGRTVVMKKETNGSSKAE